MSKLLEVRKAAVGMLEREEEGGNGKEDAERRDGEKRPESYRARLKR